MIKAIIRNLSLACLTSMISVAASYAAPNSLSGTIKIDGSSTVYPITEAVAEEFGKSQPGVKITVGISGTGGGFKKFAAGEIEISDASRPIKSSESEIALQNKVDYIEIPVGYDAITIVVNPKNTWIDTITVAELKKIWEPEAQGKITTWKQIRATWPDQPIHLFGPGTDSGTYDYFTEAVVGKQGASRGDFTSSEDDNVLVQGVSKDVGALGYFGLAYYQENKDKLKAISVDDLKDDNGKGPQFATMENVIKGLYQPLARPLFIYVQKAAAEQAHVKEFVKFYISNSEELVKQVGYIPLPPAVYTLALQRFENRVVGSLFAKGTQVGVTLEDLLKAETTGSKNG